MSDLFEGSPFNGEMENLQLLGCQLGNERTMALVCTYPGSNVLLRSPNTNEVIILNYTDHRCKEMFLKASAIGSYSVHVSKNILRPNKSLDKLFTLCSLWKDCLRKAPADY